MGGICRTSMVYAPKGTVASAQSRDSPQEDWAESVARFVFADRTDINRFRPASEMGPRMDYVESQLANYRR
jgi:hypothetical protein